MTAVEQFSNMHSSLAQIGDKWNANTLAHNDAEQLSLLTESIDNLDSEKAISTLSETQNKTLAEQFSNAPYQSVLEYISQQLVAHNDARQNQAQSFNWGSTKLIAFLSELVRVNR
jgi:uncharacterized protein YejL (UPF0352 family)